MSDESEAKSIASAVEMWLSLQRWHEEWEVTLSSREVRITKKEK